MAKSAQTSRKIKKKKGKKPMKDLNSKIENRYQSAYKYRCELIDDYSMKHKKIPFFKMLKLRIMEKKLGRLWYSVRYMAFNRNTPTQGDLDLLLSCSFANPTDICIAACSIEKAIWMSGENTGGDCSGFGDEASAKSRAVSELNILLEQEKLDDATPGAEPNPKRRADIKYLQTVIRGLNLALIEKKKNEENSKERDKFYGEYPEPKE
jgi:hypothetical protein